MADSPGGKERRVVPVEEEEASGPNGGVAETKGPKHAETETETREQPAAGPKPGQEEQQHEAGGESSTVAPAPADALPHWTQPACHPLQNYEEDFDEDDDNDSALGDDGASSTASLSASILEYRTIHGRTYHSNIGNAEYWGPNDDRQLESMDLSHHAFTLLLEDKLFLAPIPDDVQKVLDVGTGSGIWAIDFADKYPQAEVIGTDLSPTQPGWVPANVKFEVDDATLVWTFRPNVFDFVHMRDLFGSIQDWNSLYRQAYKCIKPGGYIEDFECSVVISSDDGSVAPGMACYDWGRIFHEAGRKMGRPMDVVERGIVPAGLKAAGFVDVVERRYRLPLTAWPADKRLREVGAIQHWAAQEGLEGYAMYLLTQQLKWAPERVQLLLACIRKELRSNKLHPYAWVQVTYGRKLEVGE
ncbi:S-adenosyl-L-methionine-dependent methyltransferase [Pseudomassariella vexata]|uniref:S-adenosyl-L-methionine-dependent methyltransferase n=1 Tax=Pseudomassariella vexata TaxID=1141098 RepID=A0A1Y2EBK7_9PEZI|nr:S-adenosyl-L-methionine-dependent methyltransferase [Pseudomassariella vexata]ORY68797.1 S-adenosyl-L-methionine-dependent methyltransferase [Pseudomassariella vexata]